MGSLQKPCRMEPCRYSTVEPRVQFSRINHSFVQTIFDVWISSKKCCKVQGANTVNVMSELKRRCKSRGVSAPQCTHSSADSTLLHLVEHRFRHNYPMSQGQPSGTVTQRLEARQQPYTQSEPHRRNLCRRGSDSNSCVGGLLYWSISRLPLTGFQKGYKVPYPNVVSFMRSSQIGDEHLQSLCQSQSTTNWYLPESGWREYKPENTL